MIIKPIYSMVLFVFLVSAPWVMDLWGAEHRDRHEGSDNQVYSPGVSGPHGQGSELSDRPVFGVFTGTLIEIDDKDVSNIKLTVRDNRDDKVRTILVSPWTKVTKATDTGELKAGDDIRVMIRKIDEKEVAMSIIFGDIDIPSDTDPD